MKKTDVAKKMRNTLREMNRKKMLKAGAPADVADQILINKLIEEKEDEKE